ncbi:MAG: hypothetical protein ACI8UO_003157 [Verrucomicrobiales bacterium]|jgi:hypothetical protein
MNPEIVNQKMIPQQNRAAILFGVFWLVASANLQADSAGLEFFEKSVRPILVERCYECHSADAKIKGGLRLDDRASVLKGGDTGSVIVPGDPESSLLIEAVRYGNRDLQMPPKNRLSPTEVAVLEKWVAMGAPDPRESAAAGAVAGPTGMSIEDGLKFWSFKPVTNPAVPKTSDPSWIQSPVDAFILAGLEKAGLKPTEKTDKRTLIRRVTFNLTGLPPTPQEIEAFLADDSKTAFATVVDRLLDSPNYGVRWGRHWLDVARYADSNGLDENIAFGQAWRYRDYVVDAFNDDKPFDQFLIEQLAGDLMPGANVKTKTATGFLVLGAKVLAEPDMEKLVMDTIDEQLDTTGKAFMAMTLGCVRCHDHKFDPIMQRDYYALASIFKSTRTFSGGNTGAIKYWNEYDFATAEELEALKPINAEIAAARKAASTLKSTKTTEIREAAREKATDYLIASKRFDSTAPLTVIAEIAEPFGLHPRILHHCRLHLEYNRDDPFFAPWHGLDEAGVEARYRPLFEGAQAAFKESKAKPLADKGLEPARAELHNLTGFLAVPPKPEFAFDSETLTEYYRLMEAARVLESGAPDAASAMGVSEQTTLASLPISIRGSHTNLGEPIAREFPIVMRTSDVTPSFPANESGRYEFAKWMASGDHPLTARVFVNRVWRWHFGAGIVRSTENFGRLGDRPSHPELLDWLATRFVESGWSTKELHRLILNSSVYQLANSGDAPSADPENRLLSKFNLQRLEAEQIRDSVLAVSGLLEPEIGGKTLPLRNRQFVFNHTSQDHTKYDSRRRSLYLPVIRNNLYSLYEQFDYPDPTMPTGSRNSTVVAPQALLMMNAGLVMDSADILAQQLLAETSVGRARVNVAYERILGRPASDAETVRSLEFVNGLIDVDSVEEQQAWAVFVQSLLASNEFMYIR